MNLKTNLKIFGLALLCSVIPTLAVWLPFYLRVPTFWNIPLPQTGMETVVANYDGPLYIVVAKTLYNISNIKALYEFPLPVEYYAAHFPLYPFLIKISAFFLNYSYSMLFVTTLSSVFATYYFYKFINQYLSDQQSLLATIMFSVFPARWLIVRSVGSPEPLFVGAILASVFYFQNRKYWLAGLFGAIAQLTKSPGALLFIAYLATVFIPNFGTLFTTKFSSWFKDIQWKTYPILLIPLSLFAVFGLYKLTMNDFWAYFHSGDNIHLFFPPFQIFNYSAPWVGTFWLEEIIFVYLIGIIGIFKLIKDKQALLAWFAGIFFTTTIFVSHRDLVRYSLPLVPFMLVAYKDIFKQRELIYIIIFLLIPIYLFSIVFISQNTMPISNWTPFL